jgi:hypothetical protein
MWQDFSRDIIRNCVKRCFRRAEKRLNSSANSSYQPAQIRVGYIASIIPYHFFPLLEDDFFFALAFFFGIPAHPL